MKTQRCTVLAGLILLVCDAAAQQSEPVSVSSNGTLANNNSYYSLISADGRFVVFQSEASNLVTNDFNNSYDIFRRDLVLDVTELVSVSLSGSSGNGLGLSPAVSGDGRWVTWSSNASNLITGDTNGTWDVFLRDMSAGVTTRISLDSSGQQVALRSDQPRITPDGRFVTFESDAALIPGDLNGLKDCYCLDLSIGQLDLVSITQAGVQGTGISYAAQPADDGRFACFFSSASNLVPGDTNGQGDVFWKDLATGELRRVNVSSAGVQANNESIWPSISGDGQTVTFCSAAGTLVPGDTNGIWDLFAHDIATSTTTRLNVQPNGQQADSYVHSPTALSTDGRFVIYASLSTNLVPGDTNGFMDAFLRDRLLQQTKMVTIAFDGAQLNDDTFVPHMTPDCGVITITSEASNVVPGDTNGFRDIFATRFGTLTTGFCTAKTGLVCGSALISGSGTSSATSGSGFVVSAAPARSCKSGVLLYNTAQGTGLPFQGGTLCVEPMGLRRAGPTNSMGTPGPAECDGAFAIDLNAFALGGWIVPACDGTPSGIVPNSRAAFLTVPGTSVFAQFWGRDSTSTGSAVSDGLGWDVGP